MNLDDILNFKQIDKSNMISEIDSLPDQLLQAYSKSQKFELRDIEKPEVILIAGMGGSAIGADLVSSYCSSICEIPIIPNRQYQIPLWAKNKKTLIIASSHSGNTEEILSCFEAAIKAGNPVIGISTGGKLEERISEEDQVFWKFTHAGQPRSAVGFSFGILLSLFEKLGIIPSQVNGVKNAVDIMKQNQAHYGIDALIENNPAKRLAGQAVGRWVSIFGAEHLAPVARRWKTQINELAKAWAQFDFLPEADHNTLAGLVNPEENIHKILALFLKGSCEHQRNHLRVDLTLQEMMVAGIAVDQVRFEYNSRLAEIWDAILFGDYLSYYLSLLYEVDPTPIQILENFKRNLKK